MVIKWINTRLTPEPLRCFYKSNSFHNLLCESVQRSRIKPHLLSWVVGPDLWLWVHSGCCAISKWENNFPWEGLQEKIKPFTFRDQSINNFQIRYAIRIGRGWPEYICCKTVHGGRNQHCHDRNYHLRLTHRYTWSLSQVLQWLVVWPWAAQFPFMSLNFHQGTKGKGMPKGSDLPR